MKNPFSPSRWRFGREPGRFAPPSRVCEPHVGTDQLRRRAGRSAQVAAKPADIMRAGHLPPVLSVAQRLFRPCFALTLFPEHTHNPYAS